MSKRGECKVFKMEWELTGFDPLLRPLPPGFHMDEVVAMETLGSFRGLGHTCLCVSYVCVSMCVQYVRPACYFPLMSLPNGSS